MIVHLIDGTYELFRQFYGIRRGLEDKPDPPLGAVAGVLHSVLRMIEDGATHVGVAVWPMVEFEADDALASAAWLAEQDASVEKICIWTPDKDLAQCVRTDRVVQVDRRQNQIRDAAAVQAKFGVTPERVPDFLALVGDTADGYPGIDGCGKKTAARLINQHGPIESFPPEVLGDNHQMALLFKRLATLRTDAQLFDDVDELRWQGPTPGFAVVAAGIDERLAARAASARMLVG